MFFHKRIPSLNVEQVTKLPNAKLIFLDTPSANKGSY